MYSLSLNFADSNIDTEFYHHFGTIPPFEVKPYEDFILVVLKSTLKLSREIFGY